MFETLQPMVVRNESTILRTIEAFLERGEGIILIEAPAIEGGKKAGASWCLSAPRP
jgi:hypothetical protein